MSAADDDFRCTFASADDGEPLAGSAPTDTAWLLVEQPGAWGRQAPADSELDADVAAYLAGLAGVRVQLLRRPGGGRTPDGVRVFAVDSPTEGPVVVRTALLASARDLLTGPPAWQEHADPLWLVCTNGKRDRCCAEIGRPVAAALAARWPEATWETTHLGGHRFSGTLLALPSGLVLGRVGAAEAVAIAEEVLAGGAPRERTRGRAGVPAAVQAAVAWLAERDGLTRADAVRGALLQDDVVLLHHPGGQERVRVEADAVPRRQSCGDLKVKPALAYRVVGPAPA